MGEKNNNENVLFSGYLVKASIINDGIYFFEDRRK